MGTQDSTGTQPAAVVTSIGSNGAAEPVSRSTSSGPPSTRASRTWIKVLPALVLLAVILMFVFQNSKSADVSFATASGRIPLALALLGSAALGGLLVLALGSVRILQLRKVIRRLQPDQISHRD